MDAAVALARIRELLRPGATHAVIGLACSRLPAHLPTEVAAALTNTVYHLTEPHWEHPSPTMWPPPDTYAHMRRLATRLLPGARSPPPAVALFDHVDQTHPEVTARHPAARSSIGPHRTLDGKAS